MSQSGNTVLVIDDDPNFAEGLCETLELEGFSCAHADSVSDAVKLATQLEPEVTLTDFQLPGATGFMICQSIKKALPETMIVLMTGRFLSDEEKRQGADLGVAEYLTKPFDLREFAARIRRILSEKETKK